MRTAVLVLFGVVAAVVCSGGAGAAAPVPKHLMGKVVENGDKAKLQGKWKLESMKVGGKDALPAAVGIHIDIEIKDDRFTMKVIVAGMEHNGTATLTYGTGGVREFKTTNMQMTGPDGRPVNNGGPKEQLMGYALDGDKLLLASDAGGKTAADPLKPGANDTVMVLVRVK